VKNIPESEGVEESTTLCGFPWTTLGDGVHVAEYKHECGLPAAHSEDHTCACKKTIPVASLSVKQLQRWINESATIRPHTGAWPIVVRVGEEFKEVKVFSVDDEKRHIVLEI
jgi:hypothetical protein